ncbi:hypothetical protein B0H19DRAFT_1263735 [Mycena capillaripes]|nr:hypothetical protein B0H19DRAFT_1263735 [Mycena capillaripes]
MLVRASSVVSALLIPMVFATPYSALHPRSVQLCCIEHTLTEGSSYDRLVLDLAVIDHYTVPPGASITEPCFGGPCDAGFFSFTCDDYKAIAGPGPTLGCGINCVETS